MIAGALLALPLIAFCAGAVAGEAPAGPELAWELASCSSGAPGNVFHPGEPVSLALTLKGKGGKALSIKGGTWQIREIGDVWPYPWSNAERFRVGDVRAEAKVAPAEGADALVRIDWKPDRLGSFGVFLKLDDGTGAAERMATGFIVTYPPAPGMKPLSPVIFNLYGKYITDHAEAMKRLGAKWIRWETSWHSNEPKAGQWDWSQTDPPIDAARKNDLLIVAIMAHAPEWAMPLIAGKFHVCYRGTAKWETNVTPQYIPQWQEWTRRYVERYKDVVRAGIMLNEPWEGGSISGWHGSGAHYRAMLRAFFGGAHAADRSFTVLANDSCMNVEDNLLCEPGMIQYVDAVSVHTYRSYLAYAPAQFAAYGKRVWDTESWNGVGEAENVHQVVHGLSQGFVKTQPCSIEDIIIESNNKAKAWIGPTGQALSVLLHFIEDTDYAGEPFPEAMPWVFVFSGRKDGPSPTKNVARPSAVAVIWGRDKWKNAPSFPQVTRDGVLTLPDPKNELSLYDVKGNLVPCKGNDLQVPLTYTPFYLVSAKGADDLIARLRTARLTDMEPVQITLHDFTAPLATNPPLRVTLANVARAPLSGTASVKAPDGWQIEASKPFKDLAPGKSVDIEFAVRAAKPVPFNRYPFSIAVTTANGDNSRAEELSVAAFAKGTPSLDGTAEDWQKIGAIPVFLTAKPTPVDSFLQYAFPFMDLKENDNSGYFAQFMGMWDDENFYVFADVNDPKAEVRPSMNSTWYAMHGAPNEFEYWMNAALAGAAGDTFNVAFNAVPYGEKQIANFPPDAQRQVPAKWRVPPADHEISLYLANQQKIEEGDYEKAADELLATGKPPWGAVRPPKFVQTGEPIAEVWRLMGPGMPRHNYFPFSPRLEKDQGVVPGAKLAVRYEDGVWRYRAAIPWAELSLVKPLALAGRPVAFTFICKNDSTTALDWNRERSASRQSQAVLHPTWEEPWAPMTEWGFVGQ